MVLLIYLLDTPATCKLDCSGFQVARTHGALLEYGNKATLKQIRLMCGTAHTGVRGTVILCIGRVGWLLQAR